MLSGEAKKQYQREYMRQWQRKRRGSKQIEGGLNNNGNGSKQVEPMPIVSLKVVEQINYQGRPLTKDRQVSKRGFNG